MRQCEIDGKVFKSSGSYRVHRHRFHREQKQAALVPETKEPEEEFVNIESSPEPESQQSETEPRERSGSGGSGGAALAGVALLVALGVAWWLKNKRD